MMMTPNFDIEDLERLEALASGKPPPTFEEAFAMLNNGTPRDVAEEKYAGYVRYYTPDDAAVDPVTPTPARE